MLDPEILHTQLALGVIFKRLKNNNIVTAGYWHVNK
jgi:hypothetical protein